MMFQVQHKEQQLDSETDVRSRVSASAVISVISSNHSTPAASSLPRFLQHGAASAPSQPGKVPGICVQSSGLFSRTAAHLCEALKGVLQWPDSYCLPTRDASGSSPWGGCSQSSISTLGILRPHLSPRWPISLLFFLNSLLTSMLRHHFSLKADAIFPWLPDSYDVIMWPDKSASRMRPSGLTLFIPTLSNRDPGYLQKTQMRAPSVHPEGVLL